MSRIATLAAVLTMVVAPAAFAGPADLRSPDTVDRATPAQIDLRTPDSRVVFTSPVAQTDLRSPDAATPFVPAGHTVSPVTSQPSAGNDNGVSTWAILAIIAGALGACALLAVMLRRHFQVGRPVGV
jgi:hypothetical protein